MNRRDAIKAMGALAGAASMSKVLTACGDADDSDAGIDTLVFLMMENRSYDHYFGARSLLGSAPGDGLREGMTNPALDGTQVPIFAASAGEQCVIDPPHGWDASRTQFAAGQNDGFVIAHQEEHGGSLLIEPMQYMLREHLPVSWALADAYTTCDRWFSSVLGPTLPNRMYWHAATSNGAMTNQEVLNGAFEGLPTIYHRLNAADIDWAYYYGDFPVLAVLDGIPLSGRLRPTMDAFIADAAAGALPPVVYIDPTFSLNDDHPPHHPLLGQQLIAAVYQALATSPHWERCMLVVTYDENGGFFDHVPPPKAADERAAQGFDQLGFRVPAMVIGPYTKQGYVSSVVYDHTSALKHLENVHGLEPLTARSSAASDLTDCIDLERLAAGQPAAPIALPGVEIDADMLPASCQGSSFRTLDHDVLQWAEVNAGRLGHLYRRNAAPQEAATISAFLDRHNLGRIRR